MEIEEIIPVPLPQIQTEDKRLQSGTNSRRTWEKDGFFRNKESVKRIRKRATSESAWSRDRIRNLKRSIWSHKILIPKKMCAVNDDIYTTGKYHTQSGKGVRKMQEQQKVYF